MNLEQMMGGVGAGNHHKQHKSLVASRQNSSRSNFQTPSYDVVTKSTSEANSAVKATENKQRGHGKNSSRQSH